MTLVSQIVTDAYRQGDLIALGLVPSSEQQAEALRYLNRIIKSVFGNEAGDQLTGVPLGSSTYVRPSGYPWYSVTPDNDWFVPKNTRLMVNTTAPQAVYLHPAPDDGCRVAVTGASTDLTTNYVVLWGNGRLVNGAQSFQVTDDIEFFYRDDLASWQQYSPLLPSNEFPFPEEFDDYFITMLAMRLNPSYAIQLDPQTQEVYRRAKSQLQARYTQNIPQVSELALIRPAKVAADRDQWGREWWLYNPNSMFSKGWPW